MNCIGRYLSVLALLLPGLTLAQATSGHLETLSLRDLAARLLGDSGRAMIDVDRPRYPFGPVTFYGRAKVLGSQFGLCGAVRATVTFDETGEVDELLSETRYGVAGNTHPNRDERSDANYERNCAAVASTRHFFPAPDAQSALEIAWYVEAISGEGPFADQDFTFSCSGACSQGKENLKWLTLDEIDSAFAIPCPSYDGYRPACYQITVWSEYVGLFPKTFSVFGNFADGELVITRIHVDVGSTLARSRPNNSFKRMPLRGTA